MSRKLSKRLAALQRIAGSGETAADIGCDHGFLSIALVRDGAYSRVIACDLREGPLQAAREHIEEAGLSDRIECRRADGLKGLSVKEADTVICAGMGGALMIRILSESEAVVRSALRLVLQPQSELKEFRCFLREHGFRICSEDMVFEDGKYYPMMTAENGWEEGSDVPRYLADAYGGILLRNRHPVLKSFLEVSEEQNRQILKTLRAERPKTEEKEKRIMERALAIETEGKRLREALRYFG